MRIDGPSEAHRWRGSASLWLPGLLSKPLGISFGAVGGILLVPLGFVSAPLGHLLAPLGTPLDTVGDSFDARGVTFGFPLGYF